MRSSLGAAAAKVLKTDETDMKDDRRLKRRVRNSYIVSTLSMALVLFLLGSVGYLLTAAMEAASALQESVTVMVELRGDAGEELRETVRSQIEAEPLVRAVTFSSREEKAEDAEFRRMFGQEFEEVLGENPLRDSFEVQLTAKSGEKEAVEEFIRRTERTEGVERVSYPAQMAERLHATVGKIRFVLLLFGGALLIISLILLHNTIRLAIYSKRYLINTLKLVGATKWYIMRPFLGSSLAQGLWAGLFAALLFGGAVYGLNEAVPELTSLAEVRKIGIIAGGMVLCGEVLSLLFTAAAVNRFVNMKTNRIYLY